MDILHVCILSLPIHCLGHCRLVDSQIGRQAGAQDLLNVAELMWGCAQAAAAEQLNCMDRSRGFSGHQFEEQPHLVPQPFGWTRNCFSCGQPGHLARECTQRISRALGIHVGLIGRAYPHPWLSAGLRPLPVNSREPAFLINREDVQQGWQQHVARDFGGSRNAGCAGQVLGNRNIPFIQSRVGDRARERRSGWEDVGTQPHLSVSSRPSDESYAGGNKKSKSTRRPSVNRSSSLRRDLEGNEIASRPLPDSSTSACEDGENSYFRDKRGSAVEAPSSSRPELPQGKSVQKVQTGWGGERRGLESASDSPGLQNGGFRDGNSELTSSSHVKKAGNGNQDEIYVQHARPGLVEEDRLGSADELENGEILLEDNLEQHGSRNSRRERDGDGMYASNHAVDGRNSQYSLPQLPVQQLFGISKQYIPTSRDVCRADMQFARAKAEGKDMPESRSRFGNTPSRWASGLVKDSGLNTGLDRKCDKEDREGSEWFSAKSDLDQVGDGGVCRGASHSNSSCAGFANCNEISTRGGEVNSWQDADQDPSSHDDTSKKGYQNQGLEGDLLTCSGNPGRSSFQNYIGDNRDVTLTTSKLTGPQPSLALLSLPNTHINSSQAWNGLNPRDWNTFGRTEQQTGSRLNPPGCAGRLQFDNVAVLPRALVPTDSKQFHEQSEQLIGIDENNKSFMSEQRPSLDRNEMQGGWLEQKGSIKECEMEVGAVLVDRSSCIPTTASNRFDTSLVKNVDKVQTKYFQVEETIMRWPTGEEHYNIDARVEKLMSKFPLIQGKEQDSVAEALMAASQRVSEDEVEGESEGLASAPHDPVDVHHTETKCDVPMEVQVAVEPVQLYTTSPGGAKPITQVSNMHCLKFPTAGGDWKLTPIERSEATGNSTSKPLGWRKEVLNRGVSLCEVENSGLCDPRKPPHGTECLQQTKLEVPGWASGSVAKVESTADEQPVPTGATPGRYVSLSNSHLATPELITSKGVVSTSRTSKTPSSAATLGNGVMGTQGKEFGKGAKSSRKSGQSRNSGQKPDSLVSSRKTVSAAILDTVTVTTTVALPGSTDNNDVYNGSSGDHNSRPGSQNPEQVTLCPPHGSQTVASDVQNLPSHKTRKSGVQESQKLGPVVLRRHELQLDSGVWHYLDAAGHERGPFLMSALQSVVAEGRLPDGASVFRKSDNVWVPVSHLTPYHQPSVLAPALTRMPLVGSSLSVEESEPSPSECVLPSVISNSKDPSAIFSKESTPATSIQRADSSIFHKEHPQFLGYTNGKLHELVMKSFRGSFAGFFNDALELWMVTKRSMSVPEAMALVSTPDQSPASTSPLPSATLAGVSYPATSMEPSSGLRKIGGKTIHENRQACEAVTSQKDVGRERLAKTDTAHVDVDGKGKRSSTKTSGNRLSGTRDLSSPIHSSLNFVASADHLMSQQLPAQSSHSNQAFDAESPCHVKPNRFRKEKAADSVPLISETVSSDMDGSPSTAEHDNWVDIAQDVTLCKQTAPQLEMESNSSTVSQAAAHTAVACSAETKGRDVTSDGAVDTMESNSNRRGSVEDGIRQKGWAGLTSRVLSKVLRLLCGDPNSLAAAMATCHSWKKCAQNIKVSAKNVDLSGLGLHCNDAILETLLGYGGGNLKRVTLDYCTNVSSEGLGQLLKAYPAICEVEINGCVQLRELVNLYPQVRFLGNPWAVKTVNRGPIGQVQNLENRKVKKVKYIGEKRPNVQEFDGYSGCSLEENGYREKSTENDSPRAKRTMIDLLDSQRKDTEAPQVGHRHSREAKRSRVSTGKETRCAFSSGTGKNIDQQSIGNGDDKGGRSKGNMDSYAIKRKSKAKLALKKQSSALHTSKKAMSMFQKSEVIGKEVLWSPKNVEKELEKALAAALKTVMDADIDQVFFHLANEQVLDGRGAFSKTVQMDFCTVQKKLKMGLYGGKDGVKSFKEDLNQPLRSAFRLEHDTPLYKTAGRVFKVAHQVGQQLDNLLSRPHLKDPNQGQSRVVGSGNLLARNPAKSRGPKSTAEKQRGTKRSWEIATGGGRIVKGKVLSIINGGIANGDYDINGDYEKDRDREIERESRHVRMRRNNWSESEAESSDEEDVDEALYDEPEEEDSETSGSDVASKSDVADEAMEDVNDETESDDTYYGLGGEGSSRDWWGARMTKAAMVPPLTRKYEVIEEYRIVDDIERVALKMKVELPEDYEEKLQAAKEKGGDRYAHLDVPDLKECKPRKQLGEEVVEQEVYGIDPFTYNLLLNTMPPDSLLFTEKEKKLFIEEKLLRILNKEVSSFTGSGKAPMEYPLEKVISRIINNAHGDQALQLFCTCLLKNMKSQLADKYVAYRKGLGVVCNKSDGFGEGDFVVEFFGEVYPPWRWYEKQDGIRSLQKKDKDPAPEFYNIVFERPKGDSLGYDVLVVDAMHKANFASRLCHSCRPNCEAKVTAVNGKYMIGVYTLRKIEFGEELTFDYCCVTESKEEHDSSVCLCGSQGCKGSYLCYTGPGAYDEVLKEYHGILDRHNLLLQACTSGSVTAREMEELKQAGLGACLLDGLPHWVIKYAAGIVSYLNFERQRLPEELMKAESLKQTGIEIDRQDIEVQTEGVYNQRLQNLAITLDKVRHILTELYEQPSLAPPPLRMLEPHELIDYIWKGKDSVVGELLQCMAVHAPDGLADLTRQIKEHNPPAGGDIEGNLQKSLLWLRDTLRKVPATCMGRHDAAADLIHLYAYTKHFFTNYDYGFVDSKPLLIYACDLGPRHSGAPPFKWYKSYNKNYVWGQLISWFRQTSADPGASLVQDRRGCLMLPDVSSCYARTPQHDFRCVYSDKDRKKMISHMENQPQKKWTRKWTPELWNFKSDRGLYGSPMLDAVVSKTKLNKECISWLKNRETVFRGPWDEE